MNRSVRFIISMFMIFAMLGSAGICYALTVTAWYPASDAVLINPYIGNAVWASDATEHAQPFTLVYADLTWADFEPEQGRYDFASFEERNQFSLWRAQGKHVVFRFVMDVPSSRNHRDIPDWLYHIAGEGGKAYHVSYGRGYSPAYNNPVLIAAHAKAIAALGARYGDDPFFAYVEIGSLGHWGEWHLHNQIGAMPQREVCEQYVTPYIKAFPHAKLMMRRPYAIAAQNDMGLFNDASGALIPTQEWLDWIEHGTKVGESNNSIELTPMPDAWRTSPIGGELATTENRGQLLGLQLTQTLDLFIRSHTSWIGPGSFSDIPRDGELQKALNQVQKTLGYRLRVERCTVSEHPNDQLLLTMVWKNDGVAPFYFDWQTTLSIKGTGNARTLWTIPMRLSDILPGQAYSASMLLPLGALSSEVNDISIGIINPDTGMPGVALSMIAEEEGLWYTLLSIGSSRRCSKKMWAFQCFLHPTGSCHCLKAHVVKKCSHFCGFFGYLRLSRTARQRRPMNAGPWISSPISCMMASLSGC